MATFVRVDSAFPHHQKTLLLENEAGPHAAGHVVLLWLWASQNRPDGGLHGLTDEHIAMASRWPDSPAAWVKALRKAGFLDGASGKHSLHDWAERNEYFDRAAKRDQAARRQRKRRGSQDEAEQKAKGAKPLSKQAGLVGRLAAAYRSEYNVEPSWAGGEIIDFDKKRKANAHRSDDDFVVGFRDVYLEDNYWLEMSHPFYAFTRHLDRWIAEVRDEG